MTGGVRGKGRVSVEGSKVGWEGGRRGTEGGSERWNGKNDGVKNV